MCPMRLLLEVFRSPLEERCVASLLLAVPGRPMRLLLEELLLLPCTWLARCALLLEVFRSPLEERCRLVPFCLVLCPLWLLLELAVDPSILWCRLVLLLSRPLSPREVLLSPPAVLSPSQACVASLLLAVPGLHWLRGRGASSGQWLSAMTGVLGRSLWLSMLEDVK